MSLFVAASKGIGWNTIGTLYRSILGLAQLALLSRFFSAAELGTYSQLFILTSIVLMLSDFGLTAAAISKHKLATRFQQQLGLSFIMNGLLVCVGLIFLAPWIGLFFQNPQLTQVLLYYSPVVVILAIGQYSAMYCQRKLNFKTLVTAETAGVTVGFIALCLGLYAELGIFSVVLGLACSAFVRTVFLLVVVKKVYLALWCFKLKPAIRFYNYGYKFTSANLLSLLVTSSDIIFISRLIGLEQTGQYGLIKDLVFRITTMINPILTRVALPFYAKLQKHASLGAIYCSVKELLCYLTVPIYGFFIFFPEVTISVLLADKWIHLALLLQILSGWMIVRSVMSQSGSLLNAVGRVQQSLNWNVVVAILFPIVIYTSANYGTIIVATSMLGLQMFLYTPHWFWQLNKAATISFRQYVMALIRPLFACSIALLCVMLVMQDNTFPIYLKLITMLIMAAIIYLLVIVRRLKTIYQSLQSLQL